MVAAPEPVARPLSILLLSTYELGRQPFGVAAPAGILRAAGHRVDVGDLAIESLDEAAVRAADLIGFHVPMHTATRLAAALIPRVRSLNPGAHLAFYGLYADLNDRYLREAGADSVIGKDPDRRLAELAGSLSGIPGDTDLPRLPDRTGLPRLERYARLRTDDGERLAGSTEATRGCRHRCRHCPIVPVYGGRFVAIPADVVVEDIRRQVAAGAEHITFGDPDFLNGPTHSLRIVERIHREFPHLTYDVTVKVQHLVQHLDLLPTLKATGCVLVTTAVESFDDAVLERFDKRHTSADLRRVIERCRALGLALNPTFVAFTPWTDLDGYARFLQTIRDLGLHRSVSPVQYAIRLLITARSRLLELPDVRDLVGDFDEAALVYPWRHPDPRLDQLHAAVTELVVRFEPGDREPAFRAVWDLTRSFGGRDIGELITADVADEVTVPYLTEPWYC